MKTEQTPKHTPGPWLFDETSFSQGSDEAEYGYTISLDKTWGRKAIARLRSGGKFGFSTEETKANAKLIASAPTLKALNNELLEALEEARNGLKWRIENDNNSIDKSDYEKLHEWESLISKCKDL